MPKSNWLAMWIFLGAIAVVALLGADSDLRPSLVANRCRWTGYSDVYAANER
ncbi:hypothetical protein [Escherichia coli]|uniref:hypothetical protein n=1 Tax=Escherichia coli TaxID=562 RepID=UPI003B283F07